MASILALSAAEAELIAIMACATEISFMRKLMTELGFPPNGPTMLYEDNTGAIALAETGHFKGRSKHFDLRFKWVVDMLDLGLFKLDHVSSPDQHADTGRLLVLLLRFRKWWQRYMDVRLSIDFSFGG